VNPAQLRSVVLAELKRVAPEIDEGDLRPGRPLRAQVDLDSMDWLNFVVALHQQLGVEIPESEYRRLATLDQLLGYLATRVR
jgi:acyl carrier protein